MAERSLAPGDIDGAGDGGQSSSPAVSFRILWLFVGLWDGVWSFCFCFSLLFFISFSLFLFFIIFLLLLFCDCTEGDSKSEAATGGVTGVKGGGIKGCVSPS